MRMKRPANLFTPVASIKKVKVMDILFFSLFGLFFWGGGGGGRGGG